MNLIFQNDQQLDQSPILYSPAYANSTSQFPTNNRALATSKHIYYKNLGALTIEDYVIFSRIPEHPVWSQMARLIDFSFADELFSNFYLPYSKRPYTPSLLLKIHLVKLLENVSDSELESLLMFDLAVRRFVGMPLSCTRIDPAICRVNGSNSCAPLFQGCFGHILTQAYEHKLWGKRGESWLLESIRPYMTYGKADPCREVMRALLAFIQHMRKYYPHLFLATMNTLKSEDLFHRFSTRVLPEKRAIAYSKLIANTLAALLWLEQQATPTSIFDWDEAERQQYTKLQERLLFLLNEIVGV